MFFINQIFYFDKKGCRIFKIYVILYNREIIANNSTSRSPQNILKYFATCFQGKNVTHSIQSATMLK
jgi:hypothetical protein